MASTADGRRWPRTSLISGSSFLPNMLKIVMFVPWCCLVEKVKGGEGERLLKKYGNIQVGV